MAFHHTLFDLAFFVAPAMAVALSDEEKSELSGLQKTLERRKSELALCGRNRAFAARIKTLQMDIAEIETAIADMRMIARYRRNV